MNLYYNVISYFFFVLYKNSLCVVYFVESGDWCRVFIMEVFVDGFVYVYYFDYGNIEMVLLVRVRLFF